MPLIPFAFTPVQGYRDSSFAPTDPASEAAFRDVMQDIPDQLRDELNELYGVLNSTADGNSAMDNLGMTPIVGLVALTPQAALEEINAKSPINIVDGSVTDQKLSNTAGQIKDVVEKHTQQLADSMFIEKLYGLVGDGVTDDSVAMQNYANYCLTNKRKLKLAGKKYYCPTPITISNTVEPAWSIFEIEGELSGSAIALAQSSNPGTTIITNGNSAFMFEFFNFFNDSVKLSKISFSNIGSKNTSKAIQYRFNQTSYASKHVIQDVNVRGFDVALEFQGLSATFEDNYFGTTYIEGFNAYQCNNPIHFNNAYANLIEIKNSMLHISTVGGIKCSGAFGGGIISLSSTHFEGCEPAAIVPGVIPTTFSLHNVTSENTGVTSGKGMFDLTTAATNTNIRIDGYYLNALMPDFELVKNSTLRVADSAFVTVRSKGGLVYTPNNVKIAVNDGDYSFVLYPYEAGGRPTRNKTIARYSGFTALRNPGYDADVPVNLLNDYTFTTTSNIYEHRVSFGTDPSKRYLVASWLFETTGSVSLTSGSQFIYDSTIVNFTSDFVQTGLAIPLVGVIVFPVQANSNLIALAIGLTPWVYSTPAYVSFEPVTRSMTLSSIGHPKNIEINDTVTITNGSSFVFRDVGAASTPYAISASLILNGGKDGFIEYNFYGTSTNGQKYVDTISASKNVNIVVTAANGIDQDLYNVTVTNNTGGNITAGMKIKYRS